MSSETALFSFTFALSVHVRHVIIIITKVYMFRVAMSHEIAAGPLYKNI